MMQIQKCVKPEIKGLSIIGRFRNRNKWYKKNGNCTEKEKSCQISRRQKDRPTNRTRARRMKRLGLFCVRFNAAFARCMVSKVG